MSGDPSNKCIFWDCCLYPCAGLLAKLLVCRVILQVASEFSLSQEMFYWGLTWISISTRYWKARAQFYLLRRKVSTLIPPQDFPSTTFKTQLLNRNWFHKKSWALKSSVHILLSMKECPHVMWVGDVCKLLKIFGRGR